MNTQMFYTGWDRRHFLKVQDEHIYKMIVNTKELFEKFEVDIEKKEVLKAMIRTKRKINEINRNIIRHGETVDIDDNGVRWEGDVLNGVPFGYGCIYNEDGKLIYTGFINNSNKICYGTQYFSDSGTVEYCGGFLDGLRFGYGCQYDKEGRLIYEGYWNNDRIISYDVSVEDCCEEDSCIHNLLTQLQIGSNCFNSQLEVTIENYPNLKMIRIESQSFRNVKVFKLEGCNELLEVAIETECFCRVRAAQVKNLQVPGTSCSINACSKLTSIKIGNGSFGRYNKLEMNGKVECGCVIGSS